MKTIIIIINFFEPRSNAFPVKIRKEVGFIQIFGTNRGSIVVIKRFLSNSSCFGTIYLLHYHTAKTVNLWTSIPGAVRLTPSEFLNGRGSRSWASEGKAREGRS